jgi:hypothetical protein
MTESDKTRNILLASSTALLMSALGRALDEIAALKGPAAREWFDSFEKQVVTGAKNLTSHGIPMEIELESTDYAIHNFKMVLDGHRSKLK